MKRFQWHKKSIASYFLTLTVILVLIQVGILVSLLIFGGVFEQAKINSYKALSDTVKNRGNYLQQEMENRWTNLAPYLPELNVAVSQPSGSTDETFERASDTLIQMLRSTAVTGVYLILDDLSVGVDKQPALYFRDYDPMSNTSRNDDIYVIYGPASVANKHQLPLDAAWQYQLTLTDDNKNFFQKPFEYSTKATDVRYLGYWSEPFQLTEGDIPIITYSMPVEDLNNNRVGVVGIELSVSSLVKYLPMAELQPKDSFGYILGKKGRADDEVRVMMTTNNIQKRFLDPSTRLDFDVVDNDFQVFTLNNKQINDDIYASMSKLALYEFNSPFQDDEWYIIGFVKSEYLLNYVNRIARILGIIVVILLVSGMGSAIFISRKMSQPVVALANQVVKADKTRNLKLKPTGLSELDDLSKEITRANTLMLDSASRLSKILDLVELPIGAFEMNRQSEQVVMIGPLYEILAIPPADTHKLESKAAFEALLNEILLCPEPDGHDIYKLPSDNEYWVRVKMSESENYVYGTVEAATEEVLQLRRIKQERDIDPLTKLLNRKSFQTQFEQWATADRSGVAALVMFDLDFLKAVNDTYGHQWGDYYITESANRLRMVAGADQQLLGRRSGDEFVMLLHGFSSKEALRQQIIRFYEQLNTDMLEFPGGEQRPIRISAGFVWIANTETDVNYEEILHCADEALYYSKDHEKGYFTEYHDQLEL